MRKVRICALTAGMAGRLTLSSVTPMPSRIGTAAGSLAMPWLGMRRESPRTAATGPVANLEPVRAVPPAEGPAPSQAGRPDDPAATPGQGPVATTHAAADSLFDHSEDIEFILDPVRLQRGRATVSRPPATLMLGPLW